MPAETPPASLTVEPVQTQLGVTTVTVQAQASDESPAAISPPAASAAAATAAVSAVPNDVQPRLEPDLECHGVWEVHRKKQGWTPLAPALQPALDDAMTSAAERVELLVDTAMRSWVPSSAAVDEVTRQRCAVYIAFPRESKMGKLGGEPPRPIRRRPGDLPEAATEPQMEFHEEEDPLMFTAKPVDGIVIHSSIFERLQQGVSERYAGHRYAEESAAYEQPCVEGAC